MCPRTCGTEFGREVRSHPKPTGSRQRALVTAHDAGLWPAELGRAGPSSVRWLRGRGRLSGDSFTPWAVPRGQHGRQRSPWSANEPSLVRTTAAGLVPGEGGFLCKAPEPQPRSCHGALSAPRSPGQAQGLPKLQRGHRPPPPVRGTGSAPGQGHGPRRAEGRAGVVGSQGTADQPQRPPPFSGKAGRRPRAEGAWPPATVDASRWPGPR